MKSTQQAQQAIENLNNEVLALMESAGTDWMKPWSTKLAKGIPHNYFNKRNYNGINLWLLNWDAQYTSTAWATKRQWETAGYTEFDGDGTVVILVKKTKSSKYKDKEGKPIQYWLQRHYVVYNSEQVAGFKLPDDYTTPDQNHALYGSCKFANSIVESSGADIRHGDTRAYFVPSLDFIGMPDVTDFKSIDHYYATLLHELTHWTGHKDRLDRFKYLDGETDRKQYAFEELVAEFGSAQLCALTGADKGKVRDDHAKYLNNWMKALRDNPKYLPQAIALANKSTQYLLDIEAEASESQVA